VLSGQGDLVLCFFLEVQYVVHYQSKIKAVLKRAHSGVGSILLFNNPYVSRNQSQIKRKRCEDADRLEDLAKMLQERHQLSSLLE
jgi:hypothetical protein